MQSKKTLLRWLKLARNFLSRRSCRRSAKTQHLRDRLRACVQGAESQPQALTIPVGKTKASRPKTEPKPAVTYIVTKGEESAELVMRIGKGAANLSQDAEVFTLLGFAIEKDAEGKEVLVPGVFTDKMGVENPASRRSIATAIEEKTAFEGYTIAIKE
jgi:hypothetical protein